MPFSSPKINFFCLLLNFQFSILSAQESDPSEWLWAVWVQRVKGIDWVNERKKEGKGKSGKKRKLVEKGKKSENTGG
jgi:hypothetical protein